MAEDDSSASRIERTMLERAVSITRFISVIGRGKNVQSLVYVTYMRCVTDCDTYPDRKVDNPLAKIIRTARNAVQGDLEEPAAVPPEFAKYFVVGRDAADAADWAIKESAIHERVGEELWPTAALLYDNPVAYHFRSADSQAMTRVWASLLGLPTAIVRKEIDEIHRQIDRGREGWRA
jgi:hypothetical protein